MSHRESTQEFAVFNILVNYCEKCLTPELIEVIVKELVKEMQNSPCAWAFKEKT